MRDRENTLLWMKDLIEHMNQCHEQLQWTAEGPGESFLTEALLVDLTECLRLCQQLRTRRPRNGLLSPA
jgi:hypothetical protein